MPRPSVYGVNSKDGGIYLIKNIMDGKVYVGSTKILVERISNHKFSLRRNKHHSIHLQNAWNKYGEDVFIFGVVKVIEDLSLLVEREQYYINLYESSNDKFGYNICPLAKNNLGSKHTRGRKKKSKRMTGSGNNFYGKKHSEAAKYYIGLNSISRKLNEHQIAEIKRLWNLNLYSQQRLSEMFDVTQPHISKIINNKRRKTKYHAPA